jgi:hypothetical protein
VTIKKIKTQRIERQIEKKNKIKNLKLKFETSGKYLIKNSGQEIFLIKKREKIEIKIKTKKKIIGDNSENKTTLCLLFNK